MASKNFARYPAACCGALYRSRVISANDPPSNIVSCMPCVLVPQALHRAFAMNATHDLHGANSADSLSPIRSSNTFARHAQLRIRTLSKRIVLRSSIRGEARHIVTFPIVRGRVGWGATNRHE